MKETPSKEMEMEMGMEMEMEMEMNSMPCLLQTSLIMWVR